MTSLPPTQNKNEFRNIYSTLSLLGTPNNQDKIDARNISKYLIHIGNLFRTNRRNTETEIKDSEISKYIFTIRPDWENKEYQPKEKDLPHEVRQELSEIVQQLYLFEKETDKFYSQDNADGLDRLYNFIHKTKDIYHGRKIEFGETYHDPFPTN